MQTSLIRRHVLYCQNLSRMLRKLRTDEVGRFMFLGFSRLPRPLIPFNSLLCKRNALNASTESVIIITTLLLIRPMTIIRFLRFGSIESESESANSHDKRSCDADDDS